MFAAKDWCLVNFDQSPKKLIYTSDEGRSVVFLKSPFVENTYTRNYPVCVAVRYFFPGSKNNFNLTSLLDIGTGVSIMNEKIV